MWTAVSMPSGRPSSGPSSGPSRRPSGSGTTRRVVLVRHAKSAYPSGVPDHDRPLAGKGRRNSHAAGQWFLDEGPHPDLVLCSDAQRARHSWEIIAASLDPHPPVRLEPRLYGAEPEDVVEVLLAVRDTVRTVAVVGHEPTLSATALLLAGPGSDPTTLARLSTKFPTSAVAVLRFTGPWNGLEPGGAVLEIFAVPRG